MGATKLHVRKDRLQLSKEGAQEVIHHGQLRGLKNLFKMVEQFQRWPASDIQHNSDRHQYI